MCSYICLEHLNYKQFPPLKNVFRMLKNKSLCEVNSQRQKFTNISKPIHYPETQLSNSSTDNSNSPPILPDNSAGFSKRYSAAIHSETLIVLQTAWEGGSREI